MQFNFRLQKTIEERDSLVCVGLDVNLQKFPIHLKDAEDAVLQFNQAIIKATSDLVVAYKPNLAFYEALGTQGWSMLHQTLEMIPKGIIKIGDAKRGDIGTTAQMYAKSLFDLGFDVVTVNPYLGLDSVAPFIEDENKGVFILCLTSNPSSRDFQYLETSGRPLYELVAEKVVQWNKKGNCGLVVGATHPNELERIRAIAPDLPFLIPGIGAQGGDLEASVMAGTNAAGGLSVINSSRSIIYATSDTHFADAARREADKLRQAINSVRVKKK